MRVIGLFLLSLCVASNAWAQAAPAATPPAKFNAQGKIQIGYDKRADYPLIKQLSGTSPASTAAKAPGTGAQSVDGSIFDPRNQVPSSPASNAALAGARLPAAPVQATTAQPLPAAASAVASAQTAAAPLPAKPALSGDGALFRTASPPAPALTPVASSNNGTGNSTNTNGNNNNSGNGSTVNGYAVVGGKLTKL